MKILPYAISWVVLATVVIALAVYRKVISNSEDDTLHVLDKEAAIVSQQVTVARKLESIDKWGKVLTVLVVLYGLAIAGAYVYLGWVQSSTAVVAE